MWDDLEAEIESARAGAFHAGLDTRKYEEAKALFEKALQLEPGNQRAIAGIADCEEMLRGYVPVQHMVPVGRLSDASLLLPVEGDPTPSQNPPAPRKMPWELLREKRQRDREGMAYTGTMFGRVVEEASSQADGIIAKAVAMAGKDPSSSRAIHDAAVAEIEALQERLHRGWKGHGPDVLGAALEKLEAALKVVER
jgi:hypothetical protein